MKGWLAPDWDPYRPTWLDRLDKALTGRKSAPIIFYIIAILEYISLILYFTSLISCYTDQLFVFHVFFFCMKRLNFNVLCSLQPKVEYGLSRQRIRYDLFLNKPFPGSRINVTLCSLQIRPNCDYLQRSEWRLKNNTTYIFLEVHKLTFLVQCPRKRFRIYFRVKRTVILRFKWLLFCMVNIFPLF